MTNQTARVLELLRRFNNNEKIYIDLLIKNAISDSKDNVDNLWRNYNFNEEVDPEMKRAVSEKTIRRDLDVIKEYFPNSFEFIHGGKGEKGFYKAITKQAFDNFMQPETLSLMALTFSMASKSELFESFDLNADDKKLIAKELKNVNRIYEFKNKPFETTKADKNILSILQHSIKFGKCIIVEYPNMGKLKKVEVKPYKILFMNENFYLAFEIEHEDYMFGLYRVSKINTVEETSKTFRANLEILDFIKDIQTPFARYVPNYKNHLIDVVLEVESSKAYFFNAKKHLKSQEILEKKENGNLLVGFKVTQELEVKELIKMWIPYLKVIKPLSLKNTIENELREYLE